MKTTNPQKTLKLYRLSPRASRGVLNTLITVVVVMMLATLMGGCGNDCAEKRRLGDFEFQQGNYANAILRYEQALAADSTCPEVPALLEKTRGFMRPQPEPATVPSP